MKRMHRGSGLVLTILWLMMAEVGAVETSRPSFGVFEMLEGQGVEICEACLQAFETIASGPDRVGLSGCERNYDPALGLSDAKWTELEPLKHLALLKKVMLFLYPVDPDLFVGRGRSTMFEGTIYETDDTFRREIKMEMKHHRLELSLAIIDVDNDGRREPVVQYRRGNCGNPENRSARRALVVLTPDRKGIDRNKSDVLLHNDGKSPGHAVSIFGGGIYGLFSMKDVVYFDVWDNDGLQPDTVLLYRANRTEVSRICKYRYERRFRSESLGGRP